MGLERTGGTRANGWDSNLDDALYCCVGVPRTFGAITSRARHSLHGLFLFCYERRGHASPRLVQLAALPVRAWL
eukprot:COSAG06_NODE_886_length_11771_cov_13.431203_4_plen_74_part_00